VHARGEQQQVQHEDRKEAEPERPAQERRQRTENVWRLVEPRLPEVARSASRAWRPFLLLGVLLLGYRLVEMIPERDFGFLFKLVPVVLVIAAFGYLKENPFKIHAELSLEGE